MEHLVASILAYETRAYLMMLVDCTIFYDGTFTLIEAQLGIRYFGHLYRYLGDVSMYNFKQLGRYPTPLYLMYFNLCICITIVY